jgi:peptidylprolyl isomerase
MIRTIFILLTIISLIFGATIMAKSAKAQTPKSGDLENTLYLDLKDGRVVIEMRPDLAPKHVKRIKELTRQGFYNGLVFHRVIDGFMAQTGDPTGTGSGGSGQKLKAEFSKEMHLRGAVSMARAMDVNSADSQFFICLAASTFLDGQYTYWGKVVSGMEFVDKIKKGEKSNNGSVSEPDKIIKMQVAADVKTQ